KIADIDVVQSVLWIFKVIGLNALGLELFYECIHIVSVPEHIGDEVMAIFHIGNFMRLESRFHIFYRPIGIVPFYAFCIGFGQHICIGCLVVQPNDFLCGGGIGKPMIGEGLCLSGNDVVAVRVGKVHLLGLLFE